MTLVSFDQGNIVHNGEEETKAPRAGRFTRQRSRLVVLRNTPYGGTWTGVIIATAGLLLIALAWGKTAGLTNVGLQVPYILSAGFSGLGLIAVGLTVVNISVKRADARERIRQVSELRTLLSELRGIVAVDTTNEVER